MRVLFIDCYQVESGIPGHSPKVPSSMSIGYGVTASRVICDWLERSNVTLIRPLRETAPYSDGSRAARLKWVLRGYRKIADAAIRFRPDVILAFHSFAAFPTEVKRILLELDIQVPIVAYTHGSHWDPSDKVRHESYPGLEILDLANLSCLDRVLFDSQFICDTLLANVAKFNQHASDSIKAKSAVVGLPLDTELIDSLKTAESSPFPTIVFNHAPVAAKDPASFVRVLRRVMPQEDCAVLFTRAFDDCGFGGPEVDALRHDFGSRVILGSDMTLKDYFTALWRADIQVSTAIHESLGISTLEAMYTENCCLMPRLGSYPEITRNNDFVLYDSLEELEQLLLTVLRNPALRTSIASDLASKARKFAPAVVVPSVLRCLREVIN